MRRQKKNPFLEEKNPEKMEWISMIRSIPISQEIGGLFLCAFAGISILSCISFSHGAVSKNYIGLLGYYLALTWHYLFGWTSYAICIGLLILGVRLMKRKERIISTYEAIYSVIFCLSLSMLLNVIAENTVNLATWISQHVFTQGIYNSSSGKLARFRYNVGGVPLYYLYMDAPYFNLHRLLSHVGTAIVSGVFLIGSLTFLTNFKWKNFWDYSKNLLKKLAQTFSQIKSWKAPLLELFKKLQSEKKQEITENFSPTESQAVHSTPRTINSQFPPPYYLGKVPPPSYKQKKEATPFKPSANVMAKSSSQNLDPIPNISNIPKPPMVQAERKKMEVTEARQPSTEHHQSVEVGDIAYNLPPAGLLREVIKEDESSLKQFLQEQAEVLRETLLSFGIESTIGEIHSGPRITSFEVHPAVGVKVQKIKVLENDIALNMQAKSTRIIAPIPGKAAVGIEIPSPFPQEVSFRELLEHYQKQHHKLQIPLLLGKGVSGQHVMSDLTKMPHCIIAGATGSGKSVCINTIVLSIIMNAPPDQVKLLMVDPKKVELTPYSQLPHMIAPVITEPDEACAALNWLVREMEYRYEVLKQLGLRNIISFNQRKRDQEMEEALEIRVPEKMFYIVGIIDELADLMMVSTHDIETPIARIAQMARAVGIHLILATQRPSREVITGLIKANFPTRIAFKVASRVNSQIILDDIGAESLLGNGDMLFLPPGTSSLCRVQGAYLSDEEIQSIVSHICERMPTNYLIKAFENPSLEQSVRDISAKGEKKGDSLYEQAFDLILETGNASTTFLQRKLKIGYARAASLIDQLEETGVISPQEGNNRARKILAQRNSLDHDREEIYSQITEEDEKF